MQGYGHPDPHQLGLGTAALPSYGFAGTTDGMYCRTSGAVNFSAGGAVQMEIQNAFAILNSSGSYAWSSGTAGLAAVDVALARDAAAVLALKNGTTAQALRVYGTTTGPKYLSLGHNGTDGFIDTPAGAGGIILGATNGTLYIANKDTAIARLAANGIGQFNVALNGTLTSSPADFHVSRIDETLAGAFTITRLNYFSLGQPTGAATVTDAALFRTDAAVGTHKMTIAGAAVAVTLGNGPTGSTAGNPQGWFKVNINGTLRYTPFW